MPDESRPRLPKELINRIYNVIESNPKEHKENSVKEFIIEAIEEKIEREEYKQRMVSNWENLFSNDKFTKLTQTMGIPCDSNQTDGNLLNAILAQYHLMMVDEWIDSSTMQIYIKDTINPYIKNIRALLSTKKLVFDVSSDGPVPDKSTIWNYIVAKILTNQTIRRQIYKEIGIWNTIHYNRLSEYGKYVDEIYNYLNEYLGDDNGGKVYIINLLRRKYMSIPSAPKSHKEMGAFIDAIIESLYDQIMLYLILGNPELSLEMYKKILKGLESKGEYFQRAIELSKEINKSADEDRKTPNIGDDFEQEL